MKKIYLLLSLLCISFGYSQEVMTNGGFETWDDINTPTGFTHVENAEQESTEVHSGSYSVKHTGGTKDLGQRITGITAGTSYTLTMWYKVEAGTGDGTDARIWSKWATDGVNDNDTDADVLQGPETTENEYLETNGNVWTEYTTTVTAPAGANEFYFEVRTYSGAVVYYDDFSFYEESEVIPTLEITSPEADDVFTSGDVTVEFAVQNFTVGTGSGVDGHIHYTLDDNAAVMVYNTDAIELTDLAEGDHTITLELVDASHNSLDPEVTASVDFTVSAVTEVANLAALRAMWGTDDQDLVFELLSTPTVTYYNEQSYGTQIYIQDDSAGILIWDSGSAVVTTAFETGDGITNLQGTLTEYNGLLEFEPTVDPTQTTGSTVSPENVSISTLLTDWEDYESQLVTITDVDFADADGTAVFASSTSYDITDESASTLTFRTLSSAVLEDYVADYIGEIIPSNTPYLTIIVGEYNGTPQVFARSLDDFNTMSSKKFNNAAFSMYPNPVTNGTLYIESNVNGAMNVQVFNLLGKQVLNQNTTSNSVNVSTLKRGVYLVKVNQNGTIATQKLVIK